MPMPPIVVGQSVMGTNDSQTVVYADLKPEMYFGQPIPGGRSIAVLGSATYTLVSTVIVSATDGTNWLYVVVRDNANNPHSAWAQVINFS